MTQAISIQGVTKTFGPKVAVRDLDLVVPTGSLYGFIGPNGAGKSTTIRMVMAILFPDRGTLSVLGKASAVESKDRIGYLPEERGLYRKMKVAAFLEYMAKLKGVDAGAALKKDVADWLERVGLADCAKKKCQELSKGMQQKVQFIASVIHKPDLIILDEPFSGLDPVNSRLLRDLIHEQHAQGRTVIFSTHVMAVAEQICDHVVMINRGRKMIDAPIEQIRSRYDPRTIILEPARPEADISPIARIPGIARIEPGEGHWEVHLLEQADPAPIMRGILEMIPLRRIEIKRVSLEDIFIDIVLSSPKTDAGGEENHFDHDGGEHVLRAALRASPEAAAATPTR